MIPPLFFYQLALLGLLWLCALLHLTWPSRDPVSSRWPVEPETPVKSRRKRSKEPTPFVGLTHKLPCGFCRNFCSGGHEGAVTLSVEGIRRPGSRTLRPQ